LRQSVTAGPSAVCHADFTAMHSELRENVPLAPHTTIGLGGDARYFWDCASESELREALQFGVERRLPIQVLGGGSNMIFSDAGYPGLVVKIGIQGAALQEAGDAVLVQVAAGADWDALVREAVDRGLAGIECLSGIPGTVGATPVQNVGAYGQEIAETLVSVACLDRASLERRQFRADECRFAYRQSRFKREDRDRYIILEVTLRLRKQARPLLRYAELADEVRRTAPIDALAPAAALGAVRDAVLALRRRKSMVLAVGDPNARSVGSFFLNPILGPGALEALRRRLGTMDGPVPTFPAERAGGVGGVKVPAAWLVERAGFAKGYRRGGVGISSNHALALVNHHGTTAELLALAEPIERAVYDRFGIRLEREPVVVG